MTQSRAIFNESIFKLHNRDQDTGVASHGPNLSWIEHLIEGFAMSTAFEHLMGNLLRAGPSECQDQGCHGVVCFVCVRCQQMDHFVVVAVVLEKRMQHVKCFVGARKRFGAEHDSGRPVHLVYICFASLGFCIIKDQITNDAMRRALAICLAMVAHAAEFTGVAYIDKPFTLICDKVKYHADVMCDCLRASSPGFAYSCVAMSVNELKCTNGECGCRNYVEASIGMEIHLNITTNNTDDPSCKSLPSAFSSFNVEHEGGVNIGFIFLYVLAGLAGTWLACVCCALCLQNCLSTTTDKYTAIKL